METYVFLFTLLSFYTVVLSDELDDIFMSGSNANSSNVSGSNIYLSERHGRHNVNAKSSDPIIFPNWSNSTNVEDTQSEEVPKVLSRPIPLKFLRDLAQENDIQRIFQKYVNNVKVKDIKGHTVLVNKNGHPIDVGVPIVASRPPVPPPNFGPLMPRPSTFAGTFSFQSKIIPPSQTIATEDESTTQTNTTTMRLGTFGALPAQPVTVAERIGPAEKVELITNHAGCEPELKTVQIPPPSDPFMIQIPSCIRIEQCGGCCLSNLLTCEPTAFKTVQVQIQKLLYKTDAKLEHVGTQKIVMQAHSQCRCGCRVKATDCSPLQVHDEDQCQCVCRNWRDSLSCQTQELKIWNSAQCQCECREMKDCNSGFMFDPNSCNCIPIPTTKVPNDGSRRRRERNIKPRQRKLARNRK